MPVSSRPLLSERFLQVDLICESIFTSLSPASLVNLSRTCRTAYAAITTYNHYAFSVDRALSRFFPSPPDADHTCARARAFRSLQARTSTLISGSVALQFFERTLWPESDLDLYVYMRHRREVGRWLLREGYVYKPQPFQEESFEAEVAACVMRRPNGIYSMPGVMAIFTFVKPAPSSGRARSASPTGSDGEDEGFVPGSQDGEGRTDELKVQMIVAKSTPMEVVLGFHSTCVMNVISYEKAYCLFPRATLEEHRTLVSFSCLGKGRHMAAGLAKYQSRGYHVLYRLPRDDILADPTIPSPPEMLYSSAYGALYNLDILHSATTRQATRTRRPSFPLGWRWIDDGASWVIPLPLEGVALPGPANTSTPPLTHDPVAVCNWEVEVSASGGAMMSFQVATASVLRYRYLVTDQVLLSHLKKILAARLRVEQEKQRLEIEDWTFYDAELPSICRDFLHGLASRRLSSLRL